MVTEHNTNVSSILRPFRTPNIPKIIELYHIRAPVEQSVLSILGFPKV